MANLKSDSDLKQTWRNHLKKVRQALHPKRREEASKAACSQLLALTHSAKLVLSFANFGSEINLWPFLNQLTATGRLVLPRVEKGLLRLFRVTHESHLEKSSSGIFEPNISLCFPIDFSQIDIALIPGLGFDLLTKHRLGYGRGHYDRLLTSTHSIKTCGIGFMEQAVEKLPYTSQDIPLTHIYLY
jgi:5-formyltetrahydrofolate cyclo-ligase